MRKIVLLMMSLLFVLFCVGCAAGTSMTSDVPVAEKKSYISIINNNSSAYFDVTPEGFVEILNNMANQEVDIGKFILDDNEIQVVSKNSHVMTEIMEIKTLQSMNEIEGIGKVIEVDCDIIALENALESQDVTTVLKVLLKLFFGDNAAKTDEQFGILNGSGESVYGDYGDMRFEYYKDTKLCFLLIPNIR